MRVSDLFETITKMKKHEHGYGLTSYQNDDIVLAGGMRSGNSDSKHTRLKYLIYDIAGVDAEDFKANQDDYKVGFVELFVLDDSGKIDGLVNIELGTKLRRQGIGKKVIQSLMMTVGGDLKVFDIKPKAISFWKKVGVKDFYGSGFKDKLDSKLTMAMLKKKAKYGLYGIIKR